MSDLSVPCSVRFDVHDSAAAKGSKAQDEEEDLLDLMGSLK